MLWRILFNLLFIVYWHLASHISRKTQQRANELLMIGIFESHTVSEIDTVTTLCFLKVWWNSKSYLHSPMKSFHDPASKHGTFCCPPWCAQCESCAGQAEIYKYLWWVKTETEQGEQCSVELKKLLGNASHSLKIGMKTPYLVCMHLTSV